jgi:PAS domain S-box-containing protein
VDGTTLPPEPDLLAAALDTGSAAGRERVRLAMANFGLAFFESDLTRGEVLLSPNGFALFGLAEPEAPRRVARAIFWSLYHPDDLASARARFSADLDRSRGRDDYRERVRILRADDGRQRWIEFTGHMFGPPGARTHIVGMLRDVTEAVEAEERRALLAREVEHRANNILAVVQALVRLTRGDTVAGYRDNLEGRLRALARTQALAAEGGSGAVPLASLVESELDAWHDHLRLDIGAAPPLAPTALQPIAMILHELATNAAKHGALSRRAGQVAIRVTAAGPALHLVWEERGGPAIAAPPARSGTGMGVIQAQARRLGGSLALDYRAEGLVATLVIPRQRWSEG